jgi:hypothetical protein
MKSLEVTMVAAEEMLGLEWPISLFNEGEDPNLRWFVSKCIRFGSMVKFSS